MEDKLIDRLENNLTVINAQLNNRDKEEFNYKPQPDSWSMLQVLAHLVDEEVYDFRARLFSVVENPEKSLPAFDPIKTLASKALIDDDYNELLDNLMDERIKSVALLRSLDQDSWDLAFNHPERGLLSARFFLTNWVAHDYIHIQQINRLAYQYLEQATDTALNYAGNFRIG